jgi:hypothetical protein
MCLNCVEQMDTFLKNNKILNNTTKMEQNIYKKPPSNSSDSDTVEKPRTKMKQNMFKKP